MFWKTGFVLAACAAALAVGGVAQASDADVRICYDYGCAREALVKIDAATLEQVGAWLKEAQDAANERARIARAVADLYLVAGWQTPIWRDRGGNFDDDRDLPGAMDCIDHAANTSAFIALLARNGALRFHRHTEAIRRMRFLAEHWAARIVENESGVEYAVDSWYFDFGTPAVVMPLSDWRAGRDPGRAPLAENSEARP